MNDALSRVMPGETFYLAAEFRRRSPGENNSGEKPGEELESLSSRYPPKSAGKNCPMTLAFPILLWRKATAVNC